MQLKDLVKPIDQMDEDELMAHLRQVRHRRSVERPAQRAHIERAEKKESKTRMSALDKLLAGMSDEDKAKLLAQLENPDGGSNAATAGEGSS